MSTLNDDQIKAIEYAMFILEDIGLLSDDDEELNYLSRSAWSSLADNFKWNSIHKKYKMRLNEEN